MQTKNASEIMRHFFAKLIGHKKARDFSSLA